jgi:uncharacterized protein YgiM (DUF1202 family)
MKIAASICTGLLLAGIIFSQRLATVTADKAELRGTASWSGKVLDRVKKGVVFDVLSEKAGWFLVQTKEFPGWIVGESVHIDAGNITMGVPQPLPPSNFSSVLKSTTTTSVKPPSDGRTYLKGPKGGCYYVNGSGKKTYVDHSFCN